MKPTQDTITQFTGLIQAGIESWIEAGKIAAEQIDSDPEWPDKVNSRFPEISQETIYAFDRIGRGVLHPKLLFSDCPGYKKLRSLPFQVQERCLKNSVDVLVKTDDGWDTIKCDVLNLTPAQARQVFDPKTGPRTAAAQRAWIESQAAVKATESVGVDQPYRITGKTLVILKPCRVDRRELARLLANME